MRSLTGQKEESGVIAKEDDALAVDKDSRLARPR